MVFCDRACTCICRRVRVSGTNGVTARQSKHVSRMKGGRGGVGRCESSSERLCCISSPHPVLHFVEQE